MFLNTFNCFIGEEAKTKKFIKYFLWESSRNSEGKYTPIGTRGRCSASAQFDRKDRGAGVSRLVVKFSKI